MNSKQKEKVTEITEKTRKSQLSEEDISYLLQLIRDLNDEISIRNTTILEIDRERNRYFQTVQKQDDTIYAFQKKILEIIKKK